MTVTLALALALQFCSVALLRLFLGKTWLRRPGTLLVLASVVYDGLSQVLLAFPSIAQWDIYRNGIQPGFIAEADLLMSAGMLAFTVAYLLTCGPRREAPAAPVDAALAARVLDWRILALASVPLAAATYAGRGYGGYAGTASGAAPVPGLASTFFVIAVTLATVAFLLGHGTRWLIPALAVQSAVLAAAGERAPVVAGVVAVLLVLARAGMRPSGAQIAATAALAGLAVVAIMGARAGDGRTVFQQASGAGTRVAALGAGVAGAQEVPGTPGVIASAAARLDGVAFTGAVLQAEASGAPRLPAIGAPQSLLLAVPSAAWPSKLSDAALNPGQQELDDFGLQQVNYLPSLPGMYSGFLSPPWLIVFLALAGLAAGLGERWLMRCCTPARLVLLTGAVIAAASYEAALPDMLVALRPAAVLAVAVWCWQRTRSPAQQDHQAGISVSDRMVPSP
jgi:hypothetical protein